ncbi:MAG: hypothetical protein U0X92_14535 [Anaerolineales bacterium]
MQTPAQPNQPSRRDEAFTELQSAPGCGIQSSGLKYIIMFHRDEGKSSSSESQPPSLGGACASQHHFQPIT